MVSDMATWTVADSNTSSIVILYIVASEIEEEDERREGDVEMWEWRSEEGVIASLLCVLVKKTPLILKKTTWMPVELSWLTQFYMQK